ncbi:DUF892 family protein [Burkholderia sp. BCC1977]|uniref:DUF892 family protein n=1 Tax=Burkholderia sp. BCC1977 TaxID=2817440 RepID=UPI002ABE7350|nr:DUF892 family protein [Burkholderia sp. BCC1977]
MSATGDAVKGALAGHAVEQVEIAAYAVLVTAAHAVGEDEMRACRERILQQALRLGGMAAASTVGTDCGISRSFDSRPYRCAAVTARPGALAGE